MGKFFKNFREYLTPILLSVLNEIKRETVLPKSLLELSTTLIPKPGRDPTEKESYRPMFFNELDAKIHNKIKANTMHQIIKRLYIMTKRIYSRKAGIISHIQVNKYNSPHK